MVDRMRALASRFRRIDPTAVGLLRRALTIIGLLIGFAIAGSSLAHASDCANPHVSWKDGPSATRNSGDPQAPIAQPITAAGHSVISTASDPIASIPSTVTGVTNLVTQAASQVVQPVLRPVAGIVQPVIGQLVAIVPSAESVIAPILPGPSPISQPGRSHLPGPPPIPDPASSSASVASSPGTPNAAAAATVVLPAPSPNLVPWAASADKRPVVQPVHSYQMIRDHVGAQTKSPRESRPAWRPSAPTRPDGCEPDDGGFGLLGGDGGPGPMPGIAATMPRTPAAAGCGFGADPNFRPPHWCFFNPHNHPS